MKTKSTKMLAILVLTLGLMVCQARVSQAEPMGTAFTYQGHLYDANQVADGLYDFQFKLFDDPNAGSQKGDDVNVADVDVIDGYFTVELDFGSDVFDGEARWLEIGVRPGDSNDVYTTLSPRQGITPTPYALQTRGLFVDNTGNVGIGTTSPDQKLTVEEGTIKATNSLHGGVGVNGLATGTDGIGVSGESTSGTGVYGQSSSSYGVHGYSDSYIGVYGWSNTEDGVEGESVTATGVEGWGGWCDFYATGPGEDYCSASSIRWKTDIQPIDDPLGKVLSLRGVYFNWDAEHGGQHDVGMIAEEVGQVLPEIVQYEEDSIYTGGMDYSKLTPLLVEAIKELKAENDALKQRLEKLEETLQQSQLTFVKEVQ